jgi:hypothetical protein
VVFQEKFESVASIILCILLVFKEIVLVVVNACVYIGCRLFLIECFGW